MAEQRRYGLALTMVGTAAALLAVVGFYADWGPIGQFASVRNAVEDRLKDPDSARFRNIREVENGYCGEVNARNSMGGYVGFRPFYAENFNIWGDNIKFGDAENRRAFLAEHCRKPEN